MVSLLLRAKYEGRNDDAEALAKGRGDADLDVFEAAALGRTARLQAILDAEPSRANGFAEDGFTALHLAAFFGHAASAALLLDRGADPNAIARNAMKVAPLHSAAAARAHDVARALLERGADPNARQEGGFTPLHSSANSGD